jgi:hypothetical protein
MQIHRRLAVLVLAFSMSLVCGRAGASGAPPRVPLRVGVFDSRAIALAYGRSPAGAARFQSLHDEYEKAKAANNEPRMKELEREGQWSQVRLHQRAFSTAGVGSILLTVADRVPGVARDAGVSLLVSKWEMPFVGDGIETVDVTLPLALLFRPDEQTLKMIEHLKATPPVPFDELGLDPNE